MSRELKALEKYMEVAAEVKKVVLEVDPEAEVYVFGSVVRGDYTAASDIDILVVTEKVDRKYEIMTRVYQRVDAPVELHVVTRRLYTEWYRRFIPESELVKV
ncbi:nucleotidyltransferase domain-containing protein [Infirmifilum sp. NZ]|uniref:nucleotidyltransferase domain-containing protein n=1 Tax=Infirmifilum sp. NZ TaxID=2926850 RepID=UPI0027A68979|nr:nucleotidyltransferase domain-containing protein [Infirmifilum sp. NZ]UNQ73732.1 nucleotidyltransferase domain-containing protein [Infirmifilum sp. NZ]